MHAGDLVRQDARYELRFAVPGKCRCQSRCRLDDVIVGRLVSIRSAAAKSICHAVNDIRPNVSDLVFIKSKALDRLAANIRDEHIRGRDQFTQRLTTRLGLEVQNHAALVATHAHAERAHFGAAHGFVVPEHITVRRFDPDDVGTHVGQHAGRKRPHDDCCQVDNTNAFKTQGQQLHQSGPKAQ